MAEIVKVELAQAGRRLGLDPRFLEDVRPKRAALLASKHKGVRLEANEAAQVIFDVADDMGRARPVDENVAVTVEDWPTAEQLGGKAGTLLGLYQGLALTGRSPLSYVGAMPGRIVIFKGLDQPPGSR